NSHGGDNQSPATVMSTIPSPLPPQAPSNHYVTPPLTVILTVILLVFFFIGFFTLYFCKCFLDTLMQAWRIQHGGEAGATDNPLQPPDAPPVNPGLELRIINSFPTFPYSSVKDLREEKYGLECAICLLEFDGDHVLRLLTTCYHVFHQECIDLWFESHKTCPKFSRSHSTGHSIVRNKPEEEDKYTLRLPEHVKIKVTRGHSQTESCVTFAELVRNRGYDHRRFGEVSDQTVATQSVEILT
ncbi:unnamed protein product, partial [Thlaspi arvense]